MIGTWMLYCSLCALGLSIAAAFGERALLAARVPVRVVWIGAVTLSLVVPVLAFRYARRVSAADSTKSSVSVGRGLGGNQFGDTALAVSSPIVEAAQSPSTRWNWRATLARVDQPLAVAWLALSSALALYFFGGIVALAWMRRRWQKRDVLGVSVLVSEGTGPAVVGAISPAIVVPEWALGMDPPQLALMLRHEQEHRRAGDGRVLTAAQLSVIAMPWNAALWWQLLRLRVAVELDCDARVLQDADARSYGDLLLEVARPRLGPRFMGATAFAERATQLERRIRIIGRNRARTSSRGARAVATFVGLAALTIAWVAPRPSVPMRAPATRATPTVVLAPTDSISPAPSPRPSIAAVMREPHAPLKAAAEPTPDSAHALRPPTVGSDSNALPVASAAAAEPQGAGPTRADTIPPVGGRGQGRGGGPNVDSLFHRLFDGITLSADQEAKARELLSRLAAEQLAQSATALQAALNSLPKRAALQAERDSALRALLTSDADRAAFDARAAPPGGRAGGRSGAPPFVLPLGGRSAGGGPGGRAGGDGGRGGGGRGAAPELLADATFHRLLDGLTLTPQQEATARAVIAKAQTDLQALVPPPRPIQVMMRFDSRAVMMQAESESAFLALLTNDADRATLQSRIVVAPIIRLPPQR